MRVGADSALAHFEQAIALFEEQHLPHSAARVTARLGVVTWTLEGDIERGLADMERAFSVMAGEGHDSDLADAWLSSRARALYFSGRAEEAMERNELALEIAEALELPERALARPQHEEHRPALRLGQAPGGHCC